MSTGSVEELTPAPKKRKQRADNVDIKEDSDLGPSGGAKHWTDEEKTRLFHWMLTDDNRWEAFGSKMNTIFREVSGYSVVLSGCCTLMSDYLPLRDLRHCLARRRHSLPSSRVITGI